MTIGHPSVGKQFEAMFAGQVAKAMFDTLGDDRDSPFSGGAGAGMFRGILAEKLGDALATRGALGVAPAVNRTVAAMTASHTATGTRPI